MPPALERRGHFRRRVRRRLGRGLLLRSAARAASCWACRRIISRHAGHSQQPGAASLVQVCVKHLRNVVMSRAPCMRCRTIRPRLGRYLGRRRSGTSSPWAGHPSAWSLGAPGPCVSSGEKGTAICRTPSGGPQQMLTVTEPGPLRGRRAGRRGLRVARPAGPAGHLSQLGQHSGRTAPRAQNRRRGKYPRVYVGRGPGGEIIAHQSLGRPWWIESPRWAGPWGFDALPAVRRRILPPAGQVGACGLLLFMTSCFVGAGVRRTDAPKGLRVVVVTTGGPTTGGRRGLGQQPQQLVPMFGHYRP